MKEKVSDMQHRQSTSGRTSAVHHDLSVYMPFPPKQPSGFAPASFFFRYFSTVQAGLSGRSVPHLQHLRGPSPPVVHGGIATIRNHQSRLDWPRLNSGVFMSGKKTIVTLLRVSLLACPLLFTTPSFAMIDTPSVKVGFSPEGSASALVLDTINSAESSIR